MKMELGGSDFCSPLPREGGRFTTIGCKAARKEAKIGAWRGTRALLSPPLSPSSHFRELSPKSIRSWVLFSSATFLFVLLHPLFPFVLNFLSLFSRLSSPGLRQRRNLAKNREGRADNPAPRGGNWTSTDGGEGKPFALRL